MMLSAFAVQNRDAAALSRLGSIVEMHKLPQTQDAMFVFAVANQYANYARNAAVAPKHLLLAMIRHPRGGVESVLDSLGLDLVSMASTLERLMKPEPEWKKWVKLPLTPVAKKAMQLAFEELPRFEQSKIGSEHILLGILQLPDDLAADLLRAAGLTLDLIRKRIHRVCPVPLISATAGDTAKHMQAQREEAVRLRRLEQQLTDWETAKSIRAYIAAIRDRMRHRGTAIHPDSPLHNWLFWASQMADELDPLNQFTSEDGDSSSSHRA